MAHTIGRRKAPDGPQCPNDAEHLQDTIIPYLIRAGGQAPSWYNCQPWSLRIENNSIQLFLDDSRDQSLYDWGHFNSLLACGAVIENILLAAKGQGINTRVHLLPDPSQPLLLGNVKISPTESEPVTPDDLALEQGLWQRHTNALLFENRPITSHQFVELQSSCSPYDKVNCYFSGDESSKQKTFAATSTAEQIRFSRKDLHEQLHRMIRWTEEEARSLPTGYTLPSMGVCGIGKTFFRITRPWNLMKLMNYFGAAKNQAYRANLGLLNCGAIGLITTNGNTPKDLLSAGRALERLWIKANLLGLNLQPHNTVLQFEWIRKNGGRREFSAVENSILDKALVHLRGAFPILKDSPIENGVFLFRIGHGPPPLGYTLRIDPTMAI